MAKKPATPAAAAPAVAPATAPLFVIQTGIALPPIERKVGAERSPYTDYMQKMTVPQKPDGSDMQSFFIAATVPDAITDAGEREKAAKDEARKISNRVSGIARRLAKGMDANNVKYAFAVRSRVENVKDSTGKDVATHGVRVYRVAPTEEAPAAS